MGKEYDPSLLTDKQAGIIGLYLQELKELREKGKIPIGFETYVNILQRELPSFPESERPKYQKMLDIGLAQVRFIRALEEVEALKGSEEERLSSIDDFIQLLE